MLWSKHGRCSWGFALVCPWRIQLLYLGLPRIKKSVCVGQNFQKTNPSLFRSDFLRYLRRNCTTNFRSSENRLRSFRRCHLRQRFVIACFRHIVLGKKLRFTPEKLQIGADFKFSSHFTDRKFVVHVNTNFMCPNWTKKLLELKRKKIRPSQKESCYREFRQKPFSPKQMPWKLLEGYECY